MNTFSSFSMGLFVCWLSVAQEVEFVAAAFLAWAERLRQSVLKSAFDGRF